MPVAVGVAEVAQWIVVTVVVSTEQPQVMQGLVMAAETGKRAVATAVPAARRAVAMKREGSPLAADLSAPQAPLHCQGCH